MLIRRPEGNSILCSMYKTVPYLKGAAAGVAIGGTVGAVGVGACPLLVPALVAGVKVMTIAGAAGGSLIGGAIGGALSGPAENKTQKDEDEQKKND